MTTTGDTKVEADESLSGITVTGVTAGSPGTGTTTNDDHAPEFDDSDDPDTYDFPLASGSGGGASAGTAGATDADGDSLTFTLSGSSDFVIGSGTALMTSMTTPGGTTQLECQSDRTFKKMIRPDGTTVEMTAAQSRGMNGVIPIEDATSHVKLGATDTTTSRLDKFGNPVAETDGVGNQRQSSRRSKDGRVDREVDGRGNVTTIYGYDAAGNLSQETRPGSLITQYV